MKTKINCCFWDLSRIHCTCKEAHTVGLLGFLFQEIINNPSLNSGDNEFASQVKRRWEVWGEVREHCGKVSGWTWNASNRYVSMLTLLKRQKSQTKGPQISGKLKHLLYLPWVIHWFNSSVKLSYSYTSLGQEQHDWVNNYLVKQGRSPTLGFSRCLLGEACLVLPLGWPMWILIEL